jgi:hypothetical protein
MYMVLALSFDEFMDECVLGEKYPEFTEKAYHPSDLLLP